MKKFWGKIWNFVKFIAAFPLQWWLELLIILLITCAAWGIGEQLEKISAQIETNTTQQDASPAPLLFFTPPVKQHRSSQMDGVVQNLSQWDYTDISLTLFLYNDKGQLMDIIQINQPCLPAKESWHFSFTLLPDLEDPVVCRYFHLSAQPYRPQVFFSRTVELFVDS